MSPSIVDQIAQEVGVSANTVTRALNGEATYRRPTYARRAKRIRELADKHGYRANTAAKAMSTGRFNAIGYLHSSGDNNSFTNIPLLKGIQAALHERNLHLTSSYQPDERLTDADQLPKLVRDMTADGLLVDYISRIPETMLNLFRRYRIPAIWINVKLQQDCVFPDDVAAGRLATEHLLERGHRKIALGALNITSHYSYRDRIEGYTQAMLSAGLQPVVFRPELASFNNRLDHAMQWFQQDDRPTAVVTPGVPSSTPLAAAAMANGLTLGKDIAFVTMHESLERSLGLAMSTVVVPFESVGQLATQELIAKIDDPHTARTPRTILPGFEQGVTS